MKDERELIENMLTERLQFLNGSEDEAYRSVSVTVSLHSRADLRQVQWRLYEHEKGSVEGLTWEEALGRHEALDGVAVAQAAFTAAEEKLAAVRATALAAYEARMQARLAIEQAP